MRYEERLTFNLPKICCIFDTSNLRVKKSLYSDHPRVSCQRSQVKAESSIKFPSWFRWYICHLPPCCSIIWLLFLLYFFYPKYRILLGFLKEYKEKRRLPRYDIMIFTPFHGVHTYSSFKIMKLPSDTNLLFVLYRILLS